MKKPGHSGETATSVKLDDLPLGRGVRVLGADPNGAAAFEKPEKVLSHPNSVRDRGRSLLDAFYVPDEECYRWTSPGHGAPHHLWLLNRLDSATSGVLLCATNEAVARAVRREFAAGRVRKVYFALVFGSMTPPEQKWADTLSVTRSGDRLRTRVGGGSRAFAAARLEKRFPGPPEVSLLKLEPETGKTHQLRVQCARRKLPIVGDKTYGQFRWNRDFARSTGRKRLFLHCAATELDYTLEGRSFHFSAESPLPAAFHAPFA